MGDIDGHTLGGQPAAHGLHHPGLVIDDKDSHGRQRAVAPATES
jgi:hypothetical protein